MRLSASTCLCCLAQVHLDVTFKNDVYYQYANYMISAGHSLSQDVIASSTFFKLWSEEFWWLKVRREKPIPNKCKVCEDLEVGGLSFVPPLS